MKTSHISKHLDELKTTWDLSSEELMDIKQKMALYAMEATLDSVVRNEVYIICAED